jgi:hypothetical protein
MLVGMDNVAVVIEYKIGSLGNQTTAVRTGQKQNGIDGILHKGFSFPYLVNSLNISKYRRNRIAGQA